MLKILHFTVAQSQGGRTQYVLNNWRYINKNKFHFDFVTFSKHLDFEDELVQQGSIVHHISCYPKDNREKFIEELDAILKYNYDILHLHTGCWEDFVVEERARLAGIRKIILHSHNTGLSKTLSEKEYIQGMEKHYQMRERLSENMATDYWACSREAAKWLYGNKIPFEKIKILKNAIDTEKYKFCLEERDRMRSRLHLKSDMIALCVIGRLVYQKNQEFMIAVMRKLKDSEKKFELYLVGEGEKREQYENLVVDYGLEGKVHFLGKRTDISALLQAFDIYCMPSRYEGFGIALIEAQCSGIPCIVSPNISEEAKVSPYITSIDLNEDLWVSRICEIGRKSINRVGDAMKFVKNAGYDIKQQIKILEELYGA